jgi:hypothetical protein
MFKGSSKILSIPLPKQGFDWCLNGSKFVMLDIFKCALVLMPPALVLMCLLLW